VEAVEVLEVPLALVVLERSFSTGLKDINHEIRMD
jgi:hypothetical protein